MKQIKLIGIVAMASVFMMACSSSSTETATQVEEGVSGTFNADLSSSAVNWKGGITLLGKYVKTHNGSLSLKEGSISLENGAITGGSFIVDMNSMTPLDDKYGETEHTKAELVTHLSAEVFFQTDSFPTASFEITGADSSGVMGDLTIRGITNSEKIINVSVDTTAAGIMVKGELTFNRQNYNVKFDMGHEEKIMADDIELKFEVIAQP